MYRLVVQLVLSVVSSQLGWGVFLYHLTVLTDRGRQEIVQIMTMHAAIYGNILCFLSWHTITSLITHENFRLLRYLLFGFGEQNIASFSETFVSRSKCYFSAQNSS